MNVWYTSGVYSFLLGCITYDAVKTLRSVLVLRDLFYIFTVPFF